MTRAYIREDRAAPLWAVIGAPLLGVPLMVALLSLASPVASGPADELEIRTEQVEVQPVGSPADEEMDTAGSLQTSS